MVVGIENALSNDDTPDKSNADGCTLATLCVDGAPNVIGASLFSLLKKSPRSTPPAADCARLCNANPSPASRAATIKKGTLRETRKRWQRHCSGESAATWFHRRWWKWRATFIQVLPCRTNAVETPRCGEP